MVRCPVSRVRREDSRKEGFLVTLETTETRPDTTQVKGPRRDDVTPLGPSVSGSFPKPRPRTVPVVPVDEGTTVLGGTSTYSGVQYLGTRRPSEPKLYFFCGGRGDTTSQR